MILIFLNNIKKNIITYLFVFIVYSPTQNYKGTHQDSVCWTNATGEYGQGMYHHLVLYLLGSTSGHLT